MINVELSWLPKFEIKIQQYGIIFCLLWTIKGENKYKQMLENCFT